MTKNTLQYFFVCNVARGRVPNGKKRLNAFKKFASEGIARHIFKARDFDDACEKAQRFREALFDNFLTPVNDRLECLSNRKGVLWGTPRVRR